MRKRRASSLVIVSARDSKPINERNSSRSGRLQRDDIRCVGVTHQPRHSLGVNSIDVRVCAEYQLAAVLVPLPFGNHFYVNATLYGPRNKHPSKRAMTERW